MYTLTGVFLLANENRTSGFMLAGFALLLVALAGFMLYKKLKRLREEPEEDDDEPESEPIAPAQPAVKFTAAAPAPEPELIAPPPPSIPAPAPVITAIPMKAPAEEPVRMPEPVYHQNGVVNADSNKELSAILNSLTDIIFEYDEHKVCLNLWYNKAAKFAVDLEIFRGKTVTDVLGAEKAKTINDALDFVAANGVATTIEFSSFFGSGKWFQSHISPVFDEKGRLTGNTTSLVTDITELKKHAIALKAKQQQLLEAQKVARLGDWVYDLEHKQTTWSENLYALLEIDSLPKGQNHFEYYISRVQADDRRAVYQFFADVSGNNHHDNQHKILTAKNNLRYFRITRGDAVKNDKGQVIRVTGVIQDITENRVIERTIKKTQLELREAQTIAKIGNWKWYPGQRDIAWSPEVYYIYGVDPNTVKAGYSHFKLLLKYVHPSDKGILLGFLKNPINLRRSSYEFRIITPAGKIKFLSLVITKVKYDEQGCVRSVIGTLQDISDRKNAEINIQQTEDNYKQVLEGIKLAAITLDKSGNIVYCNKFLANLLGYRQDEVVGLNWYANFIPDNLRSVFKDWYVNHHIKSHYVNPIICHNGEQRVISWQNTTIYDENGHIKQTTSIGEDITDQQKDRQLLINAKEQAEKSSHFKSEFLSTMSHEIRTPMNAVIGTTNLLLEENPRADQLPYLNSLKFSGENLLGIIDDILDYNKIEAGKLELNKVALNLNTLINNIRQSFQVRVMEKKLDLIVEVDQLIPKNLLGDPIRISQILNNLISNAVKFTHKGSITILVREETRNGNKIKINFTVADTGIGIDPQNLEKIFEPFVQENNLRENYGGTGLGLAIIKRLVELHGSRIKASSALGKGTQFNFTIEFEYTAEPVSKPQLNPVQKMQEGDLTGMKVLVVDDNKMNILIASRFLNKWNVTISEANNGLVATEMAAQNSYDLIIMDLQMPVMDGFEATKAIKQTQPDLPIIALTADAMPETYTKAHECGMDDYLTKPFMPEILFEKVSKHYKIPVVD
ncbi:response regulator [Mucilaginibacter mali]|uniref:histidine kinase n=1 Tax=Mucilaginibacter mali TaxID=2740462 RepID=A0A7D4TW96_9SPHI|nr:PAS domain-containing hybrid sensor histidine kinase/response regulator [Mucilaginibacter mali]QKJ31215.1 response regulator [Mucilaginibacter mali]